MGPNRFSLALFIPHLATLNYWVDLLLLYLVLAN
jgi:hypothetical protein